MPTFAIAKAARDQLTMQVNAASAKLNAYPKGKMGLTDDAAKNTVEWKRDNAAYQAAFKNLQNYNSTFTKKYKKELAAERAAKYKL